MTLDIQSSPSVARNREVIFETLSPYWPQSAHILEIASGTGEHAAYFSSLRPDLHIQPSDKDDSHFHSVKHYNQGQAQVAAPIALDLSQNPNLDARYDAMLCINMLHISPKAAGQGLFKLAQQVLKKGAPLCTYGPYRMPNEALCASNLQFEAWLKSKDPEFSIPALEHLKSMAEEHQLHFEKAIPMPANNHCLIFRA